MFLFKDKERYCLGTSLRTIADPTSVEDLKHITNAYITFQETCAVHGLVDYDIQWYNILTKTERIYNPKTARDIFVFVLFCSKPSESIVLWSKHKATVCKDSSRQNKSDINEQIE